MSQIEYRLYSEITQQQRFTKDLIAELPEPVQRYFLHAIAPKTSLATVVKLGMKGQFKLAQEQYAEFFQGTIELAEFSSLH